MTHLSGHSRSAVAALFSLLAVPTVAFADPPAPQPSSIPPSVLRLRDAPPTLAATPRVTVPSAEPDGAVSASGSASPFAPGTTRLPAAGSVLTAPVTLNANTSADAMTVTQTGAGRAITGSVTSGSNGLSAVKGITTGTGSGVNGVNSGTAGPAGKFQITASGSKQPALLSTTAGTGNAVQGVITSTADDSTPAVLGQHLSGPSYSGVGVEGDGNLAGVHGVSDSYYGIWGTSGSGTGVYGTANGSGTGVYGASSNGFAVYGYSAAGSAIYGDSGGGYGGEFHADNSSGVAVYAAGRNYGLYGTSTYGTGVYGYSQTSGQGVYGSSNSGIGVYGYTGSSSSYAGYFNGRVYVNGGVFASSYNSTSDRAVKQAFHDIDADDVLQRVEAMPIGGWDFQATPGIHHIGPMAQDFRAAFGLGVDDKHIDMTDGLGVSLAAIQALKRQLDQKEASNAELRTRVVTLEAQQAQTQAVGEQLAQLAADVAALRQSAQNTVASSPTGHD